MTKYPPHIFVSFCVADVREALKNSECRYLKESSNKQINNLLAYCSRKRLNIWHDDGNLDINSLESIAMHNMFRIAYLP